MPATTNQCSVLKIFFSVNPIIRSKVIFIVSSTSLEKNAEQVRNLVRDLDRYPSSSSGSLPQAWMLHCKLSSNSLSVSSTLTNEVVDGV